MCTLPHQKRQIYFSLVKLWISLSGVEENLKDKNTEVQHVMGVLCTLGGTLVYIYLYVLPAIIKLSVSGNNNY